MGDLPDQISERIFDPEDLAFLPSYGSGYPLLKAWLSCDELNTRNLLEVREDEEDEGIGDEKKKGGPVAKTAPSLCKTWHRYEPENRHKSIQVSL